MEGLEPTSVGRGLDPDVVAGRDVNWKGIGRVGSGRQLEGDWKGWIRTSIGRVGSDVVERGLEGLDLDVDWKGWIRTLIGRDVN